MHWADPNTLLPVWEVGRKSGKGDTSRISLERAAEEGLLPRVTGVLDDMLGAGHGLQQYFRRTAILAAEDNLRIEGETDADYVARVSLIAQGEAAKARKRGKEVHSAIEHYLDGGELPADSAASDACIQIRGMIEASGASSIACEERREHAGCCGTSDIHLAGCDLYEAVMYMTGEEVSMSGNRILVDIKTTRLNKFTKPYREHPIQLGAYALPRDVKEGDLLVNCYADPWAGNVRWWVHDGVERWKQAYTCLWNAWKLETGWETMRSTYDYW